MEFNWKTITIILLVMYFIYRTIQRFNQINEEHDKEIKKVLTEDKYKVKNQWD